jgi:hypothetical protein
MKIESPHVRHLLFTVENAALPQALVNELQNEAIACGWIRGFAVFESCEIIVPGETGRLERIVVSKGPVSAQFDAVIGMGDRDVGIALRGVFSRKTAIGVETFAGVLLSVNARHAEAHITALDDANATLIVDAQTGLERVRLAGTPPAEDSRPAAAATGPGGAALPLKPIARVAKPEDEGPKPEPGDLVDHFAFGRCEVVKCDGDRLHVRLEKDQRLKEIALEMLRVTPKPQEGEKRVFRLDRRM